MPAKLVFSHNSHLQTAGQHYNIPDPSSGAQSGSDKCLQNGQTEEDRPVTMLALLLLPVCAVKRPLVCGSADKAHRDQSIRFSFAFSFSISLCSARGVFREAICKCRDPEILPQSSELISIHEALRVICFSTAISISTHYTHSQKGAPEGQLHCPSYLMFLNLSVTCSVTLTKLVSLYCALEHSEVIRHFKNEVPYLGNQKCCIEHYCEEH